MKGSDQGSERRERKGTEAKAGLGTPPSQKEGGSSGVAIVGMGCLLPGARDVQSFWHNTLSKIDAIREVPKDRWDPSLYFDSDRKARDKVYSKWGGFLEDTEFDPLRFGIPPKALASIDPIQLLALVVVEQALLDAGLLQEQDSPRLRTSVILGVGGGLGDLGMKYGFRAGLPSLVGHYPPEALSRLPEWTEDSFPGILLNVVAGRVANRFDLGGVNFTVDAACASSLAAVYVAKRELEVGSSDVVIVGGVDTVQSPWAYLCFSKTQALSPRGRCCTFDQSADGISISEGVAVLVLKRVEDAERDNDRIYAVIRSVAGSSDGRDKSLTAPRPEGQMRALERAYAEVGISPATVTLIEAHGTGTVAGDTVELRALTNVFRAAGAAPASCGVGSVKSMIGHTKSAAGVVGLIKSALGLYYKILPPTLHVETPISILREKDSPFFVVAEPLPWMTHQAGTPRRAGVSSFGFGGTNFHAVLEEYHGKSRAGEQAGIRSHWPAELFFWGASSATELAGRLDSLEACLERGPSPALRSLAAAVCQVSGSRPSDRVGPRLAVVARSIEDLRRKMKAVRDPVAGLERPNVSSSLLISPTDGVYLSPGGPQPGKLAFLFPGQGSQYPYMFRDLSVTFPEFRQTLELADETLSDRLPRPLSSYIFPVPVFSAAEEEELKRALTDTVVAQPSLGTIEAGAVLLARRLGIKADMVAGHSYGEYVALYAAGVFSEQTLFEVSHARGRFIKETVGAEPTSMMAVEAGAEEVNEILSDHGAVWVANMNSPRQTIISGRVPDLEDAVQRLAAKGFGCQKIPVSCAFHSPLMKAARDKLAQFLSSLDLSEPAMDVYSNSLADVYSGNAREIAALLAEHLVSPLRFVEEVERMYENGARIFLELGPRTVLTGLTRQILAGHEVALVPLDQPGREGVSELLKALGKLAALGVDVRFEELFRGRRIQALDLERLAEEAASMRKPGVWLVNGGRVRPWTRGGDGEAVPSIAVSVSSGSTLSGKSSSFVSPQPQENTTALGGPQVKKNQDSYPSGIPSQPNRTEADDRKAPRANAPILAPPNGNDAVILQFQRLMSQFLETQALVMTAHLQGRVPENINRHALQDVDSFAKPGDGHGSLANSARESADPYSFVSSQAVQTQGVERPWREQAASGAPAATPGVQDEEPSLSPPSPQTQPSAQHRPAKLSENGGDYTRTLLEIVSERTGYPQDMLDLDLNIEADLGIDSIKRVEILSSLQKLHSEGERRRIQDSMEKLVSLKTLRQISEFLSSALNPA